MIHHHDEFSVVLTWKQPERGSYPRVSTPGFYVTAGWANEGTAFRPIDNLRLGDDDFEAIIDVLDSVGNCDGSFTAAGLRMLSDVADARVKRRRMLQEQIAKAQAALAEMDR
jgi:hypothetical protein